MNERFSEEAQALARRLFARHCERYGIEGESANWERISQAARAEWQTCATVCLEEKDVAKDLLVQAVAEQCKCAQSNKAEADEAKATLEAFRKELAMWKERAERAEKELETERMIGADVRARLANLNKEGVEGMLVKAGTVDCGGDFSPGLVIGVSLETLQKTKCVPLYRKVRVVEVLP